MRSRVRRPWATACTTALLVVTTACAGADHDRVEPGTTTIRSPAGNSISVAPGDVVSEPVSVTKVVDGDTLWVERDGQTTKLRLIGIDTPETHDPRKPVQCFGREATAAAEAMLAGKQVRLESDPSQDTADRYGRKLVYVWMDGELFNLKMIQAGYAHEYTYDTPYRYQAQFKAAQKDAEQSGAGLWAPDTCGGDTSKAADG